MPKLSAIVAMSLFGSFARYALLMRLLPLAPLIFTHRSRGNDSTAARFVEGSTRMIMIVSLRSPSVWRGSTGLGEFGSAHELLSAPVMRKLRASGSASGNVVVVGASVAVGFVPPLSTPDVSGDESCVTGGSVIDGTTNASVLCVLLSTC